MFDVRPVDSSGDLDLEKIGKVRPIVEIPGRPDEEGTPIQEATESSSRIRDIGLPEFDPQEAEANRFRKMMEMERRSRASSSVGSSDYFDQQAAADPKLSGTDSGRRQSRLYFRDDVQIDHPAVAPAAYPAEMPPLSRQIPSARPEEPRKTKRKKKTKRPLSQIGIGRGVRRLPSLLFGAVSLPFDLAAAAAKGILRSASEIFRTIGSCIASGIRILSRSSMSFASGLVHLSGRIVNVASLFADFFGSIFSGRGSGGSFSRKAGRKHLAAFAAITAVILLVVSGASIFSKGMRIKETATRDGNAAYASLIDAKDGMKGRDFDAASLKFDEAYDRFSEISGDVDSLGKVLVESSRFVPFLSKLSTGSHLAEAGKDISRIGSLSSDLIKTLDQVKNPLDSDGSVSYLDLFENSNRKVAEIASLMQDLEGNLEKVNIDDLPEGQRDRFSDLKRKIPSINSFLQSYLKENQIFVDVLGGNGPRKYLFLFQNNQEMRPTGGFIGTYAALDIFNGHIKRFVIDGIFNPDGQLREKIVPPAPIQKISANWSLHDSNWFPDFPTSAEKAMWFYEKTGGPTVDGVITMTPTVMQKLLGVTGPIEMEDYGVTVDKDNFLETVQQEVEIDYDKDLNQPKKILADLAPKILDRIFNMKSMEDISAATDVLMESLNEKHILIYSRNGDLERIISDNGWSGEVLDTGKDYLSVINTNISGYKTDGVIDQSIEHEAEIQNDGSVVDKVTITRHHNGGDSDYEWWNKVNSDYMRVYVPKGSELLSVSGQTREQNQPPIDYEALGFKEDPQVSAEKQTMSVDEESGTRVSEEFGKTVFGNWVYVSPKETVQVTYTYLLPFKVETGLSGKPADTYSLLVQKQSGSVSSDFHSKITYPDHYERIWSYPEKDMKDLDRLDDGRSGVEASSDLETDEFIGMAFKKKTDDSAKGLLGLESMLKPQE